MGPQRVRAAWSGNDGPAEGTAQGEARVRLGGAASSTHTPADAASRGAGHHHPLPRRPRRVRKELYFYGRRRRQDVGLGRQQTRPARTGDNDPLGGRTHHRVRNSCRPFKGKKGSRITRHAALLQVGGFHRCVHRAPGGTGLEPRGPRPPQRQERRRLPTTHVRGCAGPWFEGRPTNLN